MPKNPIKLQNLIGQSLVIGTSYKYQILDHAFSNNSNVTKQRVCT